jgi:CheY-like chemotaxis protein
VQEALTNTLKHAVPARAQVTLRYGDDALELEVIDDGGGGGPDPQAARGFGLAGMRERATLYGDVLEAGPRHEGSYASRARLPFKRCTAVIRVLLADDEGLVRGGLRMILEAQADIEAEHGHRALRLAQQLEPDVVLMDIRMAGLEGLEATRRILAAGPAAPRVIVLTTFDLDEYVYEGCAPGPAAFSSRARDRSSSSMPCAPSSPATRCWSP